MPNFEQERSARLFDDVAAFTERAAKSDKVSAKEKSKCVTTEKRVIEDAATIKSLKIQIREANSHMEEIRHQAIEDYLRSHEFGPEKMRIFMVRSRSY